MKSLNELLCDHFAAGALQADDVARIREIERLAPEGAARRGGALYRVSILDEAPFMQLMRGENVTLAPRSHQSWSRSDLALLPLLRLRIDNATEGSHAVLTRREVTDADVAFDACDLARRLGFDRSSGTERQVWHAYAEPEMEVLIRCENNTPIIRPEEVVSAWGPRATPFADAFLPRAGEIYHGEEEPLVIEEVLGAHEATGCVIIRAGGRLHLAIHDGIRMALGGDPECLAAGSPSP